MAGIASTPTAMDCKDNSVQNDPEISHIRPAGDDNAGSNPETTMVMQSPQSSFNILPLEIKTAILQYLDFPAIKKARLVCSEWERILHKEINFVVKLSDRSYKWVNGISRGKRIDELVVTRFFKTRFDEDFSGVLSGVKKLRLGSLPPLILDEGDGDNFFRHDDDCMMLKLPVPRPKLCSFLNKKFTISLDNVKEMLRSMPDLEQLTLASRAFEVFGSPDADVMPLTNLSLECLTSLEINIGLKNEEHEMSAYPSPAYLQLLQKNCFPALRTFKFVSELQSTKMEYLIHIFDFIIRHQKTLTDLTLSSYHGFGFAAGVWSNMTIDKQKYAKMLEEISKVSLLNLTLRPMESIHPIGKQCAGLEKRLITNQRNLKRANFTWLPQASNDICVVFKESKDTLQEAKIEGVLRASCDLWDISNEFDCSSLRECHKLEQLVLDITVFDAEEGENMSRVKNFSNLPQTITTLKINGLLQISYAIELLDRLINLKILESVGCGDSYSNMSMFLKVLNHPNLRRFALIDVESCTPLSKAASITPGVHQIRTRDSCSCKAVVETITFTIDRSKLKILSADFYYFLATASSSPDDSGSETEEEEEEDEKESNQQG